MATSRLTPAPAATGSPKDLIERAIDALETVIIGKEQQLRLSVACLLAEGHLLIEDLPGLAPGVAPTASRPRFGIGSAQASRPRRD